MRLAVLGLVPLLIFGGVAGYYLTSTSPIATGVPGGTDASSALRMSFDVAITHQEQRSADLGWMAQMAIRGQFWQASCYVLCSQGVTYRLDPTVITNQGHGVEQCLVFGTTITDTCTASNFPKVIGLSLSATAPAAADTYASAGPCDSANIIHDANGLTTVAGTVTAAANSASVTTTIANTFTATGAYSSVQAACLLTAVFGGTNPLIYAEGTFGPDTLASGNTLTITWQITRT